MDDKLKLIRNPSRIPRSVSWVRSAHHARCQVHLTISLVLPVGAHTGGMQQTPGSIDIFHLHAGVGAGRQLRPRVLRAEH